MVGSNVTERLDKLDEFVDDFTHRMESVEDLGKNIKQSPIIYGRMGKRFDLNENLDVLNLKKSIKVNEETIITNQTNVINPGSHTHDEDTLQMDGVNSDGGAFPFTTTGKVTFNQSIKTSGDLEVSGDAAITGTLTISSGTNDTFPKWSTAKTLVATNLTHSDTYGDITFTAGTTGQLLLDANSVTHQRTAGVLRITQDAILGNSYCVNIAQSHGDTVGKAYNALGVSSSGGSVITTGSSTVIGVRSQVQKGGADTSTGTYSLMAMWGHATNQGSTDAGTKKTYGGHFTAVGDTAGASTAYGVYGTASGADTNWAGYFVGNVGISENLIIPYDDKKIIIGAGADGEIYVNADNLYIKNVTQDKDIILGIDDGGVAKTITWDADVDMLKHSAGLFNFHDDNITTTGIIDLNPAVVSGSPNRIIDITNSTALTGADTHWTGIRILGDNLDPTITATDCRIRGISVNFAGIDMTYNPDVDAVRIVMGDGEHHAIHIVEGQLHHDYTSGTDAAAWYTIHDIVVDAASQVATSHTHAFDVALGTALGGGAVSAVATHPGVDPIHQHIGTYTSFGANYAGRLVGTVYTDNIDGQNIWVGNGDDILVGHSAKFDEIRLIFGTPATKDVKLKFYYYDSVAVDWTEFFPADNTNGGRASGTIHFDADDLANWKSDYDPDADYSGDATDAGYWIKIERNRVSTPGTVAQTTATYLIATLYEWDASGDLSIHDLAFSGAMTISANVATITHSGTTSLTIASTSGTVVIESVIFTGQAISNATNTNWDAAFTHVFNDGTDHADVVTNTAGIATNVTAIALNTTHRGDNSQAHSDYLINNGNDSTSGALTVASLITASNIGIAADTDIIQLTGANAMKVNGTLQATKLGIQVAPLEQYGINIARTSTSVAATHAAIFGSYSWTPSASSTKDFWGLYFQNTLLGANNIDDMGGLAVLPALAGSGNVDNFFGIRASIRKYNSTNVIDKWVGYWLNYVNTGATDPVVTTNAYQVLLEDYTAHYNVTLVSYGIKQEGSTLINHFDGELRIASDTNGLVLGAGTDYRHFYDGAAVYFRMLTGSGRFKFDTHTTVTQDCALELKAGTAKNASIYLISDAAAANADSWAFYNDNADNNLKWSSHATGAWVVQMYLTTAGGLYVNDDVSTGDDPVGLFDDYDDPKELQRIVQKFDKDRACEMGICEKKNGHYYKNQQRFDALLAGGIYQLAEKYMKLENRIEELENA